MQLNKGDLIRDGDKMFSVFCVLGSVIYVQNAANVKSTPAHEWKDVLENYRKIEIIGDSAAS